MAGVAGPAAGRAGSAGGSGAGDNGVAAGARAMRLVLDTNIWLDWLVFDDAAVRPIRDAVARGRAEVYMDEATEAELARVLAYDLGKRSIDAGARTACLERCRSVAKRVGERAGVSAGASARGRSAERAGTVAGAPAPEAAREIAGAVSAAAALPRCSDPHDQKFLELALAAKADVLVTKDRALLDLARRKLPFRIAPPQALAAL